MKITAFLLLTFFLSFTTVYKPIDRIGQPGPIVFNKTRYYLAYAIKGKDNFYFQNYLPTGEKLDNYDQSLCIQVFNPGLSLRQVVDQKVKELEERKKTDKTCHY